MTTTARSKPLTIFGAIIAAVCLLSFASHVTSCATTKAAVVDCAAPAAPDVVKLVDQVLAEPNETAYLSDIQALAVRVGVCIVDKAVAEVVSRSQTQLAAKASADPAVSLKIKRGEAWLAAHPSAALYGGPGSSPRRFVYQRIIGRDSRPANAPRA